MHKDTGGVEDFMVGGEFEGSVVIEADGVCDSFVVVTTLLSSQAPHVFGHRILLADVEQNDMFPKILKGHKPEESVHCCSLRIVPSAHIPQYF